MGTASNVRVPEGFYCGEGMLQNRVRVMAAQHCTFANNQQAVTWVTIKICTLLYTYTITFFNKGGG